MNKETVNTNFSDRSGDDNDDCVWSYQGYRLDPGNFTTAMVHLYRAEITRVNVWRNRLDTTTNWAVVTTAGAITFGFSSPQNPHFVILLVLMLVLIFLNIEARRYAYYSLWYHRARLLETEFFAPMLTAPFSPAPDWGDTLGNALRNPLFPISHWEAVGNRFRRNYAAIILMNLASWALKLIIHPTPTGNFREIINRASIGPALSGKAIIIAVLAIYLMLFAITVEGYRRFKKRGIPRRDEWQSKGPSWFKTEIAPHLAIIVTNHKDQIAEQLINELKRGVTAMEGMGMYTGERHDVLLCAVSDVQVPRLKEIVQAIDPDGFVIVTHAADVRGGHFYAQEPPS